MRVEIGGVWSVFLLLHGECIWIIVIQSRSLSYGEVESGKEQLLPVVG